MRIETRQLFAALIGTSLIASACGARTGLRNPPSDAGPDADAAVVDSGTEPPPPSCVFDTDCVVQPGQCARAACREGTCVVDVRKDCDDGDVCTDDICNPSTLACTHIPATKDGDGDGYDGPRPGFVAGSPGACGDDCDDLAVAIHPGAAELCDGLDNDCNGVIDDNFGYSVGPGTPVRVSSQDFSRATRAGFAYNGSHYGLTLTGKQENWNGFFKAVDAQGNEEVEELPIAHVNAASYAGGLIWTGSMFATAWEDARQDTNYEIYFNLLDPDGEKLMADLRVSNADDFSLHPQVTWNRTEFVVLWDDRRFDPDTRLFGQRIDASGALVGANVQLTPEMARAEYPAAAAGERRLGLAFTSLEGNFEVHAKFRSMSLDLADLGPIVDLSAVDANNPNVVYADGRFIVTWDRKTQSTAPGPSIYGAVLSEDGELLVSERAITDAAPFARSHTTLSLGDRILLVWAEEGGGAYDLYFKLLSPTLAELAPRTRITTGPSDSLAPALAVGAAGDVGILFNNLQTGAPQVYFMRLLCSGLIE